MSCENERSHNEAWVGIRGDWLLGALPSDKLTGRVPLVRTSGPPNRAASGAGNQGYGGLLAETVHPPFALQLPERALYACPSRHPGDTRGFTKPLRCGYPIPDRSPSCALYP